MANKSRFIIAESNIKSYFKTESRKIFSVAELNGIFEVKRATWNLPASMNTEKFIDKLLNSSILEKKIIEFTGYFDKKERYLSADVTATQLALSVVPRGYFSHYSAMMLLGLTTQIPKTIYISFEQSKKNTVPGTLSQKAIDAAFDKPQRKSSITTVFKDSIIFIHSSKFSNKAGITSNDHFPLTNLERTLIDITVRPDYAGGVDSVLEAYKQALPNVSINKLVAILKKLDFIYPYHQSIGFYLEKAGMEASRLQPLAAMDRKFDFYLTYEIKEKKYDSKWKLYHPKGM